MIDFFPVLVPVFNDIAGDRPIDRQDMGEEAVITLMTNRWDEAVYERCLRRGGVIGRKTRSEQGRFIVQNDGGAFRLWAVYPFGGGGSPTLTSAGLHTPVAENTTQGMPAGYRFYAAKFERYGKVRNGTRGGALMLQIRCMMVYQYKVSVGDPAYRSHLLYDQDCSGLPNVA